MKSIKSIKPYSKYKKIILMTLFFLLFVAAYNSDKVMFKIPKLLQDKTSIGFENRFDMYIRSPLMKSVDSINPLNWQSDSTSSLPHFNLEFTRNNMDYMAKAISESEKFMLDSMNEFQKCKIQYDNKLYKCKVRLHGSGSDNWANAKKAFAIKLNKKNLINNMRRFSFIPITKDVPGIPVVFAYKLLSHYFNFNVKSELVYLSINGISQGLYMLEEKAHKSVLEKNNYSGVDIIKSIDKWDSQYYSAHQDPYNTYISYQKFKKISKKDVGQLLKYRKILKNVNNYETVSKLIDIDKFAQFDALRILFASYGSVEGDNNKYLYDTSTGRVYPYPRIEGSVYTLKSNNYSKNFESMMYSTDLLNKNDDNTLLQTLVKNNKYRTIRNTYLSNFLKDRDVIIGMYDFLVEKYTPHIKADTTSYSSSRLYLFKIKEARNSLISNFNKISEYINYSRAFTDIVQTDRNKYIIEVKSDSNAPTSINFLKFYFKGLELNNGVATITDLQNDKVTTVNVDNFAKFFKDKEFMLNLDNNLDNEKNVYRYEIEFGNAVNFDKFTIEYRNNLTGNLIDSEDTYTSLLKNPGNFNLSFFDQSIDDFIVKNKSLDFVRDGDYGVILKMGNYTVKDNIVLPYGVALNIEAGTKIQIAHKKSLLVYGSLNVNGRSDLPVVITSIDNKKPFGTVAAIGDNKTVCRINYLDISNGSESIMNGSFLSGALSLYSHKRVSIDHSKIHDNFADDGLNIKNSNVEIRRSEFYANFADQVDLDATHAMIENSTFKASDKDKNGDGLDLSGSKAMVSYSNFDNFMDKGISVGEGTQLFVYSNNFINNRSAVTGKDSSKLYFYKNYYKDNVVDIEAFVKKPIYNPPELYVVNEKYISNKVSLKNNATYFTFNANIEINQDFDFNIFSKLEKIEWQKSGDW
jgi:hypothetical protein